MAIDLRSRLQQRLVFDDGYLAIGGLSRVGGGEPRLLRRLRAPLMQLAHGGPFVKWFDVSAEDGLEVDAVPAEPQDLVRRICNALRMRSIHVAQVEDPFEQWFARLGIRIRETTGVALPQLGESNAILCRHFATSASRAYSEVAERVNWLADTAVLFIMGVPACARRRRRSLHAWNWLVDFAAGRVWTFDPQNEDHGPSYPNLSALLYTCAAMRADGQPVPGLRPLVRRHESVHGGTTLFHLARHPIDAASRRAIVARLAASRFERIVPTWRQELEESEADWGDTSVEVADLVRFSDA